MSRVRIDGVGAILVVLGGAMLLSSSVSCIIPDRGIIAWVECGARWCASAPFAEALDGEDEAVQVQQPNPDGTSGWVTQCVCMTPAEDLVLLNQHPPVQYTLLRTQIIDATRQRCLDVAIANTLDPDPPPPSDEELEPSCYEAVVDIYRDGCCALRSDECGGARSCGPDGLDTDGSDTDPMDPTGLDSADGTTTGGAGMASLDALYHHVDCRGSTCTIGQPLIDAMLTEPEAVLAEGTSLRLHPADDPTGLLLEGVEPDGLAARLGLHEGDHILQIDHLPLTTEADLLAALAHALEATEVTVLVERSGKPHLRHFVRAP